VRTHYANVKIANTSTRSATAEHPSHAGREAELPARRRTRRCLLVDVDTWVLEPSRPATL